MDRISSDAYVEQLVWSELGDYIRELLEKGAVMNREKFPGNV